MDKEVRMAIEIGNNLPLMVVPRPKENALQKRSTSDLTLQNPQASILPDNRIGLESDTIWEKGILIDIYI